MLFGYLMRGLWLPKKLISKDNVKKVDSTLNALNIGDVPYCIGNLKFLEFFYAFGKNTCPSLHEGAMLMFIENCGNKLVKDG